MKKVAFKRKAVFISIILNTLNMNQFMLLIIPTQLVKQNKFWILYIYIRISLVLKLWTRRDFSCIKPVTVRGLTNIAHVPTHIYIKKKKIANYCILISMWSKTYIYIEWNKSALIKTGIIWWPNNGKNIHTSEALCCILIKIKALKIKTSLKYINIQWMIQGI